MDGDADWQALHDELRARLQSTGAILGNKEATDAEKEQAAQEFVEAWAAFCRHLKGHPEAGISTGPRV